MLRLLRRLPVIPLCIAAAGLMIAVPLACDHWAQLTEVHHDGSRLDDTTGNRTCPSCGGHAHLMGDNSVLCFECGHRVRPTIRPARQ